MQKLTVAYNELVRVVSKDEQIRFNTVGSDNKAVLNFTVVPYFGGGDDDSDPVWIQVALWGDMALKYHGKVEKGQVIRLNTQLIISPDDYGDEPKIKAQASVNNGYQFTLFPGAIRGVIEEGSAPAESSKKAARTPAYKAVDAVIDHDDIDDIPF